MSTRRNGTEVTASTPPPSIHSGQSRARRLAREAAEAAEVRAYETDADVVALRIEQVRRQVDRLCWAGIALGLTFTMTNVQAFAAGSAPAWSPPWLAAWLLDPMVSLVLLAILRAEQVTARYQVRTGRWARRAKWFTLGATYVLNTWAAYASGSPASIVLHSVPPLVVFAAAEAVTDLRDRLTEAVAVAFKNARTNAQRVNAAGDRTADRSRGAGSRTRPRFDAYLNAARAAWTPGTEITPAWIRHVTSCSRGLSSRLAAALSADIESESGDDHA